MADGGDYKIYSYRCTCGAESVRKIEKGNRKVRGWCKACKQFITAYNVKSITSSEREVRVSKPKSMW